VILYSGNWARSVPKRRFIGSSFTIAGMKSVLAFFAVIVFASGLAAQSTPVTSPGSATVPVTLDHNRVIIDVYFPQKDGTRIRTRAWVDPGDPEISITNALLEKLGLAVTATSDDVKPALPKELLVGDFKIDLAPVTKAKAFQERSIAPGSSASIKLPSSVLRNYDVAMDYPNREFTIASAGTLRFEGEPVKASVGPDTGLIQVESIIAGQKYTASFDPGASVSLLSRELVSRWHKSYSQWPAMNGAVGPANLWGWPEEPNWLVLRIPEMKLAGISLTNGLAATFPPDHLDWFQKRAGAPSIGVIGADVLQNYRVGIDYAHSTIYFKQLSKYTPPGIDVVGFTLSPEADGRYTIIGIADYQGARSVPDAKVGDILLAVDNARVTGGTMGQAWSLLGGAPGDVRTLTLERGGQQLTVKATVRRFLPALTVKSAANRKPVRAKKP
jgi:hypothetical protein